MTNAADSGRTGEQAGTPPPPTSAEPRLPDTAETLMLSGLEAGFAAMADVSPEPDDQELDEFGDPVGQPSDEDGQAEPEEESEGDEDGDVETPGADSSREQQPKVVRTADEWAQVLAKDGVQRLAEIPRALHAEVIAAYGEVKAQAASTQAQAQIAESIRRQDELTSWVRTIDEHFDGDPDGKLAWLESTDPAIAQQADLYRNGRRLLTRIQQQAPEERVSELSALNQRANYQYQRLAALPDAQAELTKRHTQGRYNGDPAQALAMLERDVDELMRTGYGRTQQTVTGAPEEATPRKRPARPVVGSGITPGGIRRVKNVPDISKINNPDDLISLGMAEGFKTLR